MASAGPYASLHLATDRQPHQHPTTLFFYRPDALPAAQPTASKHWRQLQTHRNTYRDRHRNRKTDRQQQTYEYSREFSHPQSLIKHKTNRHSLKDWNIKSLAKSIKGTAFSFKKKQYQNLRFNAIVMPSSKHCFLWGKYQYCSHEANNPTMVTKQLHDITHTHTRLTALFPGLPGWAGTRKVKPIWILLKQQIVSGSGISWATCKSAPRFRQTTMPAPHRSVFYRPDALPATQPTASKHWSYTILNYTISCDKNYNNQTETGSVTVMHHLWLWSLYITTHRTTTACTVTKQAHRPCTLEIRRVWLPLRRPAGTAQSQSQLRTKEQIHDTSQNAI